MIKIFSLQISKWSLFLLLGDLVAFFLAVPVGVLVAGSGSLNLRFFLAIFQAQLLMMAVTYILVFYIANLYDHYRDFRRLENLSQLVFTCMVGALVVVILFCLPGRHLVPRQFVEWHALAFTWMAGFWRFSFSSLALPVRLRRQVLVVGAGEEGRWIARAIRERPNCGLNVRGFLDDDPAKVGTRIEGVEVLGPCSRLKEVVKQEKISQVVTATNYERSSLLIITLNQIFLNGCQITDVPALYEFLVGKIPIDYISDMWIYFNWLNQRSLYYPRVKRFMDLGLAVIGLLLTGPLLLFIALAIRLDSPGPIFFRQKRLGFNGKPFQILKFRTMAENGEAEAVPQWASRNDSRVTRVGFLLRKTHLDELPQLFNILKGKMSFIGPRAEWHIFAEKSQELVPIYRSGRRASDPPGFQVLERYREQIPFYSYRLLVRPGVTGWAQVKFPYAGSSPEELKEKLEYDLYYVKHMGFLLDLAILMKTVRIVLFGHGK